MENCSRTNERRNVNVFRFIHFSDTHLGARTRTRSRLFQPLYHRHRNFQKVMESALKHKVHFIIHTGDLYENDRPHPSAIHMVNTAFLELAENGMEVIILMGNHERDNHHVDLWTEHPRIHMMAEPGVIQTTFRRKTGRGRLKVDFVCMPFMRGAIMPAWEIRMMELLLQCRPESMKFLLLHQPVEGSGFGAGNIRFSRGRTIVPLSAFQRQFNYIACGHIHRAQVLSTGWKDGPVIVFSGATDRMNMDERHETPGYILGKIDGDAIRFRHHPLPAHAFQLLQLPIDGLTPAQIRQQFDKILREYPEGEVEIRLSGMCRPMVLEQVLPPRGVLTHDAQQLIRINRARVNRELPENSGEIPAILKFFRETYTRSNTWENLIHLLEDFRIPLPYRQEMPREGGVYLLRSGSGAVVYVGQSGDLRSRTEQHFNGKMSKGDHWKLIARSLEFYPMQTEFERLFWESVLIQYHNPPGNRQGINYTTYVYLSLPDKSPNSEPVVMGHQIRGDHQIGPFKSRFHINRVLKSLHGLMLEPTDRNVSLFDAGESDRLTRKEFLKFLKGNSERPIAIVTGRVETLMNHRRIRSAETLQTELERLTLFRDAVVALHDLAAVLSRNCPVSFNGDLYQLQCTGDDLEINPWRRNGNLPGRIGDAPLKDVPCFPKHLLTPLLILLKEGRRKGARSEVLLHR